MTPTITVLQDHTEFMDRMIELGYDHPDGAPLSIQLLDSIRAETVADTYQGQVMTLGQLRAQAEAHPAQARKIGIVMANAVEHEPIRWYCIADDSGAQWLAERHLGPVIRWSNGVWWGHLEGQKIDAEVVFHASFKSRKRGKSGRSEEVERREPKAAGDSRGPGLVRPAVAEFA